MMADIQTNLHGTYADISNASLWDDRLHPNRRGQGHVAPFS